MALEVYFFVDVAVALAAFFSIGRTPLMVAECVHLFLPVGLGIVGVASVVSCCKGFITSGIAKTFIGFFLGAMFFNLLLLCSLSYIGVGWFIFDGQSPTVYLVATFIVAASVGLSAFLVMAIRESIGKTPADFSVLSWKGRCSGRFGGACGRDDPDADPTVIGSAFATVSLYIRNYYAFVLIAAVCSGAVKL